MKRESVTRSRILDESIELFAKKGYGNCGIREIAASVGIKSSSIYSHFHSKDDILNEIMEYFDRNFFKYRPSPAQVIEMARNKSFVELLPLIFFHFGGAEEREKMMKITQIIRTLQFTNEKAGRLYDRIFTEEPNEYAVEVVELLAKNKGVECKDSQWLAYMITAFNIKIFHESLVKNLTEQEQDEKFGDGIRVVGKLIDKLIREG